MVLLFRNSIIKPACSNAYKFNPIITYRNTNKAFISHDFVYKKLFIYEFHVPTCIWQFCRASMAFTTELLESLCDYKTQLA